MDYGKLISWLRKKYESDQVFIFLGYVKNNQDFYNTLDLLGYEIVFKESTIEGGVLKANCDVDLTLYTVSDFYLNKYDDAIIISGDGDFLTLINFLNQKSKFKKIIAPNINSCSLAIKRKYKVVFLENMLDTVCSDKNTEGVVS